MCNIIGVYERSNYNNCYNDFHKETLVQDEQGFFLIIEERENDRSSSILCVMSDEDVIEWCRRHDYEVPQYIKQKEIA